MALSEQEQRTLDELEAALAADDPRLAMLLGGASPARPRTSRHTGLAAVGLVAGLAALVGGMQVQPAISVLGFVVMLASAVIGLGLDRPSQQQRRAASTTHPSQLGLRQPTRHPEPNDH